MEFFDTVNARYSHRQAFLDQKVPDADLRKIVDAGIQAPSAMNTQTTSFVIVDDPELLEEISGVLSTPATTTAPAMIVVISEHIVTRCGLAFEDEDYSAAVMSMLLAVADLGYATVWMDGMTKAEVANAEISRILNVPEGKRVRTILPIGVPAERGEKPARKPFEERCTYNRF